AKIEGADDNGSATSVAAEQGTAESDEHWDSESRAGFVRVERAHLDRELVFARVAVADELLRARVQVLLADLHALAEGGRRRLVQHPHTSARTTCDVKRSEEH